MSPEMDREKAKDEGADTQPTPSQNTITPQWLIPVVIFAGAAFLFVVISGLWTTWEGWWSVKTDDAYVRADIAPLSTKVMGVVRQVGVNDFESVKAGKVLVELRNDDYLARVEQAKQAVRAAEVKLADMKARKQQQDAKVADAQIAVDNSRTTLIQTDDTIALAQASKDEARAGIDGATAAIAQSQAATKAATADVTRTSLERERQEALLSEESSTKQRVEQVVADNDRAIANLDAQKASQARASAELAARKAQLNKTQQQLSVSKSERDKALLAIRSRQAELTAQKKQRELLDGEEQQLSADLQAKKAGLITTQVDYDYTIVRAPADGVVGELKVKPGQLVSAGTQVVTLVSATPWVIANYRETQLTHVKDGDRAEVELDALPWTHLKGHVQSIAPASGAQFSLLPPDNASGNFTKITQRIPVKIVFDETAEKLSRLRPGMSAIVTISPGSGRHRR